QELRIADADPTWQQTGSGPYGDRDNEFATYPSLVVTTHEFSWQRAIPLDRHLDNLVSKSYIAALPNRDEFLNAERVILIKQFPDADATDRSSTHMVTVTVLTIAEPPAA